MHRNTIKQAYPQLHAGFQSAVKELVAKLCFLGYADTTVSFYEQGAVHFSFWLTKRHISPSQIEESHFTDFLSHHQPMCECPFGGVRQRNTVRAGLGHFAAILRSAGYLAPAEPSEAKGVDLEVQRFDEYMLNTAGLQDATRLYRRRYVREFLDEFFPNGDINVSGLTSKSIVSYLANRGARLKAASTKVLASSLRSYFRFLRLHGRCKEDLALAVPAFASWRLASLRRRSRTKRSRVCSRPSIAVPSRVDATTPSHVVCSTSAFALGKLPGFVLKTLTGAKASCESSARSPAAMTNCL